MPQASVSYLRLYFISLHPATCIFIVFFFIDPSTTEIYTLSLHDALPIFDAQLAQAAALRREIVDLENARLDARLLNERSEEHTSELQSPMYLVCRLLLEKKKKI